jgi:hypothetical protein
MKTIVRFPLILLALLIPLLIGACTTLGNLATPAANPLIQVAVDVAVAQVVGAPGPAAHAKAQQIASIASTALAVDQGSSVAIGAIQAAVNAQIVKLNLPPADLLAAQVLVQTIDAIIQQKLVGGSATGPAGTVTAASTVAIAQILQDVIAATAVY